jgi:hypothetical protein
VFGNKVLRKIPGREGDEVKGDWKNCTTRGFKICTPFKYCSVVQVKKDEMGGACGTRVRGKVRARFWWGILR